MPDASTNSNKVPESLQKSSFSSDKELSALKDLKWFIDSKNNPKRIALGLGALLLVSLTGSFYSLILDRVSIAIFGSKGNPTQNVTIHVENLNLRPNMDANDAMKDRSVETPNQQSTADKPIVLPSLIASPNEQQESPPGLPPTNSSEDRSSQALKPKPFERMHPPVVPSTVETNPLKPLYMVSEPSDAVAPPMGNRGETTNADSGAFAALSDWLKGKDTEK
jgi:hypothetical protein